MSELITNFDEIINLLPKKPKRLTKLFTAKKDGCLSSKFHQLCDDQGPTLSIFFTSKDATFVAYTEESWKSNSKKENSFK